MTARESTRVGQVKPAVQAPARHTDWTEQRILTIVDAVGGSISMRVLRDCSDIPECRLRCALDALRRDDILTVNTGWSTVTVERVDGGGQA